MSSACSSANSDENLDSENNGRGQVKIENVVNTNLNDSGSTNHSEDDSTTRHLNEQVNQLNPQIKSEESDPVELIKKLEIIKDIK